jgi:hypothetical protein
MEEDAGAVEEEPGEGEEEEGGDVDGFAEACACALLVERIEEVDNLVLFELAVAAGADLYGLG